MSTGCQFVCVKKQKTGGKISVFNIVNLITTLDIMVKFDWDFSITDSVGVFILFEISENVFAKKRGSIMSKKKRIRRMLSIFLIASMVLSYNSSCFLSVWAAADDTPAVEEEMKAEPEQTEDTEDAGEVSETEQQSESEDAIEQDEPAPAEEAASDDAEEETAVQEDPEEIRS